TARELEALVASKLKEADYHRTPRVTVDLQQVPTKTVTVTGEVRQQGPIAYAGEMTLFDALVRAGMATSEAGEEILIVRPSEATGGDEAEETLLRANLRELTSGRLTENNIPLQDG